MTNINKLYIILTIIVVTLASVYSLRAEVKNLLTYGWSDWPTRPYSEKCPWEKRVFEKAGIGAFIENCIDKSAYDQTTGYAMIFSDADKKIIGKPVTNPNSEFTIQVFTKELSQQPIDVVRELYARLSPEQQKVCEIQDVDEPITYFPDGSPNFHERPNPTAHKTRYAIDVKSEVVKEISDKYGGNPGSSSGYDFMCGSVVGTTWDAYPPYFEFDDRSPDKYLFIDSYAFEAPPIDLNSIRF